jgi:PAS domain S-box-containing protein
VKQSDIVSIPAATVSPEQLLGASPVAIWVVAHDGRTLYANDALVALLGAAPSELLYTDARQFLHHADLETAASLLRGSVEPSVPITLRVRRSDGRMVTVVGACVPWPEHELPAVAIVLTPVSAAMHGSEHLRERERQFRIAERLGNLGSWEWHVPSGKLTFSEELYRIFGIEPSIMEPTLESVVERTDPGDRDYFVSVIEEIAAGATARSFERRIHRPNGDVRVLRSSSRVVETAPDGSAVRVVGVCRDITTERRALERGRRFRELYEGEREVAERLRQLDELKFAFMSSVSHDLRAPLATVLGSAATLRDLGSSIEPATARSLLDQTIDQARQLDSLLADLLDLERLRRGINEGVFRPVAVIDLVRSTIEDLGGASRVELDVPATELVADLDPPKLERIVENLVRNALRASPARSTVYVRIRAVDGVARIMVEDSGPGVPDHLKHRVFEPFDSVRQDDTSSRPSLSLAIVGRYVRLHSGRVWVEDRREGGTRVVVDLPLHPSIDDVPPANPAGDAALAPSMMPDAPSDGAP